MRCGRCQKNKQTERYDVDGFTGYLCDECRDEWEEIQQEE